MSERIERCPYCHVAGDNLDVLQVSKQHSVLCVNCGAMGPGHADEKRAVDDWNKVSKFVDMIKVGVF